MGLICRRVVQSPGLRVVRNLFVMERRKFLSSSDLFKPPTKKLLEDVLF
jgi:hypothetical protein